MVGWDAQDIICGVIARPDERLEHRTPDRGKTGFELCADSEQKIDLTVICAAHVAQLVNIWAVGLTKMSAAGARGICIVQQSSERAFVNWT